MSNTKNDLKALVDRLRCQLLFMTEYIRDASYGVPESRIAAAQACVNMAREARIEADASPKPMANRSWGIGDKATISVQVIDVVRDLGNGETELLVSLQSANGGTFGWVRVHSGSLIEREGEALDKLRELSEKATPGEWWGHAQGPKFVTLSLADYFFARACVHYVRSKMEGKL